MESYEHSLPVDRRPEKRCADDGVISQEYTNTSCIPRKVRATDIVPDNQKTDSNPALCVISAACDIVRTDMKSITERQACTRSTPSCQMRSPQSVRYHGNPEDTAGWKPPMSFRTGDSVLCHQSNYMLPLLCPLTPPTNIFPQPRTSPFVPQSSCTSRPVTSTETVNTIAQTVNADNHIHCFGSPQQHQQKIHHGIGHASTMCTETNPAPSSSPQRHILERYQQDLDPDTFPGNPANSQARGTPNGSLVRQYLLGHSSPLPFPQHTRFGTLPSSPGNDWASSFPARQTVLCSPDGSRKVTSSPYRLVQTGISQERVANLPLFSPIGSPTIQNPRVSVQHAQVQPLGHCIPNTMEQQQLVAMHSSGYGSPETLIKSPVVRPHTPPKRVIGELDVVPQGTAANRTIHTSCRTDENISNDMQVGGQSCSFLTDGVKMGDKAVDSMSSTCKPEQEVNVKPNDSAIVVSSSSKLKEEDVCSSIVVDSDEDELGSNMHQDLNNNDISESVSSVAIITDTNIQPDSPTDPDPKPKELVHVSIANTTVSNKTTENEPDSPSEVVLEHADMKTDESNTPAVQHPNSTTQATQSSSSTSYWKPSAKELSAQCVVGGMVCDKSPSFPTPVAPPATTVMSNITPRTAISDTWKLRIGPPEKMPVLGGTRAHSSTTVTPCSKKLVTSGTGKQRSVAWTPECGAPVKLASSSSSGSSSNMTRWSVVDTQNYTGTPHPAITGRYVVPAPGTASITTSHTDITSPLYTSTPVTRDAKPTYQYLCTPSDNGRNISSVTLNSSGSEEGSSPAEYSAVSDTRPRTPRNTPVTPSGGTYCAPTTHQLQSALIPHKSRATGSIHHHQVPQQQSELELELGRSSHNLKERARRARIKSACEKMRELVPGITRKTDKATVFEYTAEYIHFLKGIVGVQYDNVWEEAAVTK